MSTTETTTFIPREVLAYEVFENCLDQTESFRNRHFGACLAYLMGAILDPTGDGYVDWSPSLKDPALDHARQFLVELFPADHAVWKHIRTDA